VISKAGELRISDTVSLPIEAARWTFADLAIKSAGKTYAAGVLAEEMIKNGIPIVAIDVMGTWWGLRVGVDGNDGLPVVVFGGDHQDIPIPVKTDRKTQSPQVDEERLQLMVKSILQARISAVIDTNAFSKKMQRRIAAVFISELYRLNKDYGTRHVFIEEADTLAPQRLSGELNFSFGAVDDLVRRGGNFNLGTTLITQRSAVLNKDVLTQCNCLIVLRILAALDKNAVKSWVQEMSGDDKKSLATWYDSLRTLENGEAWIWHPETDLFKRIKFRKRETLHATREYFRQDEGEQRKVKMTDVSDFISKFRRAFEPEQQREPSKREATVVLADHSAGVTVSKILEPDVRRPENTVLRAFEPSSAPPRRIHPQITSNVPLTPTVELVNPEHPGLRNEQGNVKPVAESGTYSPALDGVLELQLEVKELRIVLEHSEKLVSMTTENQKGQILYVLLELARPTTPKDAIQAMNENGWAISGPVFSKVAGQLVDQGLVIHDGPTYRLPRFVRFDVRKPQAES
jgi:hypothetical protein